MVLGDVRVAAIRRDGGPEPRQPVTIAFALVLRSPDILAVRGDASGRADGDEAGGAGRDPLKPVN